MCRSRSRVKIRTGMAEPGEYSPRPRKLPRVSLTSTSSPPWAPPSTRSTACANTHGWPAQTGWTCPGFSTTLATGAVLALRLRSAESPMRRLAVFAVAASVLGTLAGSARAAGDCPDGDWFCDPAPVPEQPPGPAPSPGPAGPRHLPPREPAPPPWEPPPPPGYYDDGEVRIDVPRVEPVRPRRRRGFHEWGLNLHAVIGLMGNDSNMSPNAGMSGMGGALRFRPIPHIAIEGGLEFLWGTDYNGFPRSEQALLVNGLFFANPRSAV